MQTRRLRLGDVVDDYCPRERRLSNHVIVAMVEDAIKQTRCTTCDFEHPYKDAKVPPRRKKKDAPSGLFQQVLENVTTERVTPPVVATTATAPASDATEASAVSEEAPVAAPAPAIKPAVMHAASSSTGTAKPIASKPVAVLKPAPVKGVLRPNGQATRDEADPAARDQAPASLAAAPASPAPNPQGEPHEGHEGQAGHEGHEEEAPLHRRALIRATLPRPVGEVPVRQAPSFTMREAAAARPNKFRYKARPPGGGARHGRPPVAGGVNAQGRPAGGRGPQARGAGKKAAPGHQPHRPGGGPHSSRGPKGPHGNKRFK
jgi:hypothetical protein